MMKYTILAKSFLVYSLQLRNRRYYESVRFIKRQNYFKGVAMYGHEVFMSSKASKGLYDKCYCMSYRLQCQWIEISTRFDTL
jgi:hypothetical protein